MIDNRIIQVDTRGITREIALRLSSEHFVRDLTSVARFIDNHQAMISTIIANFYLAQISRQRAQSMRTVQMQVGDIIDRHFCLYSKDLNAPQLKALKDAFFQAVASGFFTRQPSDLGDWDSCSLKKIDNETYAVSCSKQSEEPLQRGITQLRVHSIYPGQSAVRRYF